MTTIDDATLLGLAVRTCHERPVLEPLLDPPPSERGARQRLKLLLPYLVGEGALTSGEGVRLCCGTSLRAS
jgi:hypothetical protein